MSVDGPKPRPSGPTAWLRFPTEHAFASTRRAAQRTHFIATRETRGVRPWGPPCPPRELAPRVHSGGDGAAAGATPDSLTALARRARRCTDPISDSPVVGRFSPRWPPIVRGWCRKPVALQKIGGGGQGRNRTTDTRIFSTTEPPVRREQAEGREGVSPRPTEPPGPTEPMPNRSLLRPVRAAVRSCRSTACASPDRTLSEPR